MMSVLLSLLLTLRTSARSRAALQLEVLAYGTNVQVLQRARPRRLPSDAAVTLLTRRHLPLESLALRRQLGVLARSNRSFRTADRLFWLLLRRSWLRRREGLRAGPPPSTVGIVKGFVDAGGVARGALEDHISIRLVAI